MTSVFDCPEVTVCGWQDIKIQLLLLLLYLIITIDCFYIVLFSALEQTHCTCMWFYMSEQLFIVHFWISTKVVYLKHWHGWCHMKLLPYLYTTPLSDIIANHSVNNQLFADDTQLQKSAHLIKELSACTDDIKTWMTENQLKLNDDKTEALLFPFLSSLKPSTVPLPDLITLGSHNIPFSDSSRNLGFILDSKLSMKKHIIKICQTAYFELKRISSIHRFLTEDATKTCYFLYPFMAWLLQLSPHGYT